MKTLRLRREEKRGGNGKDTEKGKGEEPRSRVLRRFRSASRTAIEKCALHRQFQRRPGPPRRVLLQATARHPWRCGTFHGLVAH